MRCYQNKFPLRIYWWDLLIYLLIYRAILSQVFEQLVCHSVSHFHWYLCCRSLGMAVFCLMWCCVCCLCRRSLGVTVFCLMWCACLCHRSLVWLYSVLRDVVLVVYVFCILSYVMCLLFVSQINYWCDCILSYVMCLFVSQIIRCGYILSFMMLYLFMSHVIWCDYILSFVLCLFAL